LNANTIQKVKLEMELFGWGGVEKRTMLTTKQDNVTEKHRRIFGARAQELLKERWSPKT
jgi:hypothetical protein